MICPTCGTLLTRTVRDRCRLSTRAERRKIEHLVDIPLVLDVAPYTEFGRVFGGKNPCVSH